MGQSAKRAVTAALQFFSWWFGFLADSESDWSRRQKSIRQGTALAFEWLSGSEPARIFRWTIGWKWDGPYPIEERSCFHEAIILFILIVAQGLGFVLAARGSETARGIEVAVFGLIAFVTLGFYVGLISAKDQDGQGRDQHVFERSSVMYSRWAMRMSATVAVVVCIAALAGSLPGQCPSPLRKRAEKGTPVPYEWKDEDRNPDGLIVPFTLSEKTLEREMPSSLDFRVFLGTPFDEYWEIVKVSGWEIQGKKQRRMSPPPYHGPPDKDGNRMLEVWQLDDLDSSKRYRLEVYLHQKRGDRDVKKDAKSFADDSSAIEAWFFTQ